MTRRYGLPQGSPDLRILGARRRRGHTRLGCDVNIMLIWVTVKNRPGGDLAIPLCN